MICVTNVADANIFWTIFLFAFHQSSKMVLQKSAKVTFSRVKAHRASSDLFWNSTSVCKFWPGTRLRVMLREEGCFFLFKPMKAIDSTLKKENPGLVDLQLFLILVPVQGLPSTKAHRTPQF